MWSKQSKEEFILAYGSRGRVQSGKEEMGIEAELSKSTAHQETEREQE